MSMMAGRFLEEKACGEDHFCEVGRPCFSRLACWVAEVVEMEEGVVAVDFVSVGVEGDLLVGSTCCAAAIAE